MHASNKTETYLSRMHKSDRNGAVTKTLTQKTSSNKQAIKATHQGDDDFAQQRIEKKVE